ncbi:MAG TPA: hypothetical protein VNM90_27895 [Haliangium sp.]|nr:hypothetical protein [Haliangium sp.]
MRAPRALLFLTAVLAGAAGTGWLLWSELQPDDHLARSRGEALAAALRAGIGATADIRAPHRCARLHPDELGPDVAAVAVDAPGMRSARRRGPILELEPASEAPLTLGIVADAHGAVDALPGIRRAFQRAGVRIVVSLGGMGTEREAIARALAALAAGAPGAAGDDRAAWLLLAMPGDWEAVSEHRAAIAGLVDRGAPGVPGVPGASGVIDGSDVRLLDMDGIQLATLPGAPHPSRLMAGDQGCVFTTEDATAIAALLAGRPGVRLLLTHAPPRQGRAGLALIHPSPTDAGQTAIPMGERALADVLRATPVDAVIHGLVATRDRPPAGTHPAGAASPVILGAGSLDPLQGIARVAPGEASNGAPPGPTALVARVTSQGITWQSVTPERPSP